MIFHFEICQDLMMNFMHQPLYAVWIHASNFFFQKPRKFQDHA